MQGGAKAELKMKVRRRINVIHATQYLQMSEMSTKYELILDGDA